jgi:predicted ATPase
MFAVKRVLLNGFKSIRSMDLELRPLNVLIGPNGGGKSNFVSFFWMLHEMSGGRLQLYVASEGRAHSVLHYGSKRTPEMSATLEFGKDQREYVYKQRLMYVPEDALAFAEEKLGSRTLDGPGAPTPPTDLGAGYRESRVSEEAGRGNNWASYLQHLLNGCRVYHLHDTSATARARQACYVGNDRWLTPDAGNVAAMLYRFKAKEPGPVYRRILGTIQQVAPFFADFELEPTGMQVILNWKDKYSDEILGPHQLSDGTLRFIALATLLLQPQALLPEVIVLDEPELGLHPAALNLLAGMLRSVAHHCQVIVATQSPALVDCFAIEDVIVVDRREGQSSFERLSEERLKEWLEEYTLGQLWEKNVVGGGPFG